MRAARDTWINPLLALGLCSVGGALFSWLRTPLPWMIGPLLTMAACNFAGARLRAPAGSRQLGQLVIGCALGLYFSPAVVGEVVSYWPLLIAAALFALVLAAACGWLLSRFTDTDKTTAFFASVPGGAAEMAILGERYGGRVDRIALAQSLRILVVVVVIPFALTYSGVHGSHAYAPSQATFDWTGLIYLMGLGVAAGFLLSALRMANPFMFGPLLVATALTASGEHLSAVPYWATNLGQLLLGCALGARFEKQLLGSLARFAGAVLGSIAAALLVAMGFSGLLAGMTGLPVASLVLATAPGGIAEMCITAKVLQLGVPLVTAAHVTRVLVLISTTGPLFRFAKHLAKRPYQ